MVVQKQFVNSPLSASLNTKLDPKTAPFPGFSLIENAIRTRVGEVRKRFGYDQDALTMATFPNSNGVAALNKASNYQVVSFEDEAALISSPNTSTDKAYYVYRPNNGTWNSYSQSRLPRIESTKYVNISQNILYNVEFVDAEYNATTGHICVVYSRRESTPGATSNVYAAIYDIASDTVLKSDVLISDNVTAAYKPRVALNGQIFQIFYYYSDTTTFKMRSINDTTGVISSEVTISTDGFGAFGNEFLEVVSMPTINAVALAYNYLTGGNPKLKVLTVNATGTILNTYTDGTFNVVGTIALQADAGNLYGAYVGTSGVTNLIVGFSLNSSLTAITSPTSTGTTAVKATGMGLAKVGSQIQIYYNQQSASGNYEHRVVKRVMTSAFASVTTSLVVNQTTLGSTVYPTNVDDDQSYMLASMGDTGSLFYTSNLSSKLLSNVAATDYFDDASVYGMMPSILNTSVGYVTPARIAVALNDSNDIVAGVALSFVMPAEYVQSVNVNGVTILGGGVIKSFDGQQTSEVGWLTSAVTPILATTTGSGGSIAAGTYQYVAVYEWVDAKGNLYRSAPSFPLTAVASVGSTQFGLLIENYGITTHNQANGYSNTHGRVVLYRTKANQTLFYRHIIVELESNDNASAISVTDATADSGLGNEFLYTTGGILENEAPPAAKIINTFQNRIFLVPNENRNLVWYSNEIVRNEGPSFSSVLVIPVDDLGGDINGLSEMDDKVIFFKETAIFYTSGQGANAAGVGGYNPPSMLTKELGCIDPRSIARTNEGIIFKSHRGFYLLDRGLNLQPLGLPVELYNNATITSAINFPSLTQTRFTTSNGYILVYESIFKEWYVWQNLSSTSACMWEGRYTILKTDKNLWRENSSLFTDNLVPVVRRMITFPIQVADIQGYQRLFRLILLGEYRGQHTAKIYLAYDHKEYFEETFSITPTSAYVWTDSTYQNTTYTPGGTTDNVWQFEVRPAKQMCSSVRLMIEDDFTDVVSPTDSFTLSAIGFEVGVLGGRNRVPPTIKVMT